MIRSDVHMIWPIGSLKQLNVSLHFLFQMWSFWLSNNTTSHKLWTWIQNAALCVLPAESKILFAIKGVPLSQNNCLNRSRSAQLKIAAIIYELRQIFQSFIFISFPTSSHTERNASETEAQCKLFLDEEREQLQTHTYTVAFDLKVSWSNRAILWEALGQ